MNRVAFALFVALTGADAQAGVAQSVPERHPTIFQTHLGEEGVPTPEVSTEQLRELLGAGSVMLLDTRPHLEWAISHIPGSLNVAPKPGVPMSLYTSDVAEVDRLVRGNKAQPLVLYCNGPFCGKSKRVSQELLAAGYSSVRRYQLGAPVWRALGGVMATEPDGIRYIVENDRTAVLIDARPARDFAVGTIPGAVNIPASSLAAERNSGVIKAAKDDLRLPMNDHNTRIVVFGNSPDDARVLAEAIVQEAFHNVSYFTGSFSLLEQILSRKE